MYCGHNSKSDCKGMMKFIRVGHQFRINYPEQLNVPFSYGTCLWLMVVGPPLN